MPNRFLSAATISAIALLCARPLPARAATVVDTGMNATSVYTVAGQGQTVFGRFTATTNTITGLGGYFLNGSGQTDSVQIALYQSGLGAPDLSHAVATTAITLPYSPYDTQSAVKMGLNIGVQVGKDYWVSFDNTSGGIYLPRAAATPLTAYGVMHAGTFVLIPDFNTGLQVLGENRASAVVEPAFWAMLIAGFGAVGGALRSGRRQRDALKLA